MTSDPSRSAMRVYRLATNAADHLIATRRYDAAASILQNYLSAHPPYPGILRRLGKIRLSQGRPKDAALLFRAALTQYNAVARQQTQAPASQLEEFAILDIDE